MKLSELLSKRRKDALRKGHEIKGKWQVIAGSWNVEGEYVVRVMANDKDMTVLMIFEAAIDPVSELVSRSTGLTIWEV